MIDTKKKLSEDWMNEQMIKQDVRGQKIGNTTKI